MQTKTFQCFASAKMNINNNNNVKIYDVINYNKKFADIFHLYETSVIVVCVTDIDRYK